MIHTIKQGNHRASGIHLGVYYDKDHFKWEVEFNQTAVYNLGPNQFDINKLCGIRYFFGDNSARFGWRYYSGRVELMAYVHDNGNVTKSESEVSMGRMSLDKAYYPELIVKEDAYVFSCVGLTTAVVPKTHSHKLGFRQGLYFGGIQAAPHDIKVSIRTII